MGCLCSMGKGASTAKTIQLWTSYPAGLLIIFLDGFEGLTGWVMNFFWSNFRGGVFGHIVNVCIVMDDNFVKFDISENVVFK